MKLDTLKTSVLKETILHGVHESGLRVFIIPKKSGSSKLTLKFYNNAKDMDILETREYIVTVDENLKVKYEEK